MTTTKLPFLIRMTPTVFTALMVGLPGLVNAKPKFWHSVAENHEAELDLDGA